MNLEELRAYISVEAFSQKRVERPIVSAPDIGLRWGAASQFQTEFGETDEAKRANKRNGVTFVIRYYLGTSESEIHEVDEVYDYTPVWRQYDIVRVFLVEELSTGEFRVNFDNYIEIEHTTRMLIPAGTQTRRVKKYYSNESPFEFSDATKFVSKIDYQYEDIDQFLLVDLPSYTNPNSIIIEENLVEGQWPEGVQIA